MRGADAIVRYLEAERVRYLFGNPGTTEVPLMDALVDSKIDYLLCLQENGAIAAADGLAQATRRPTVVNLHTGPGVAQAFSSLYMASRHRAPVVVTAGNEYLDFAFTEPLLWADLVRMAEPLVKWSYEPTRPDQLIPAFRRAFKVAQTPPQGPVFLSIPLDLQNGDVGEPDLSPSRVPSGPAPEPESVGQAALIIAEASNPCVVAGDDVVRSGGYDVLVRVAEAAGLKVYGAPLSLSQPFPNTHSLWGGSLGAFPAIVGGTLAAHDVVMVLGAPAFYLYYYQPVVPLPESARLIHVHSDPWELGKNFSPEVGIVATAGLFLEAFEAAWGDLPQKVRSAADQRAASVKKQIEEQRQGRAAQPRGAGGGGSGPLTPWEIVSAAVEVGGEGLAFVDESVTSSGAARQVPEHKDPSSFFGHKGGALGWGAGAAVGVALGLPDRKVVATLGDGSLLYCPQPLWTAARYRIPVKFLVFNNLGYAIIKAGTAALQGRAAETGKFIGMDLVDPEVGFVALAEGFGVPAVRVESREALTPALEKAFATEGPFLIDAVITPGFRPLPT